MKVQLVRYQHESNGMSIQVLPETDVEVELLRAVWAHGKMETGYPAGGGKGTTGFYIKAFTTSAAHEGSE